MAVTTTIDVKPAQEGSAFVTVTFSDENDDPVTPNADTLTWTLTDLRGNVINERDQVAVASAASVTIVLSGDDLAKTTYGLSRIILFECEYDSTDGDGLPLKVQGSFSIEEIVALKTRS